MQSASTESFSAFTRYMQPHVASCSLSAIYCVMPKLHSCFTTAACELVRHVDPFHWNAYYITMYSYYWVHSKSCKRELATQASSPCVVLREEKPASLTCSSSATGCYFRYCEIRALSNHPSCFLALN
jgi:hypothetical protein